MEYLVTGHSNVGLVRSNNEDSYLIDRNQDLFVVADGMGGYQKGEVASQIACQSIKEYFQNITDKTKISEQDYKDAILLANSNIRKKIEESSDLDKMGTTVIALSVVSDKLMFFNVGDSRAYVYRKNRLEQISVDHSLIEESKKAGITKDIPKQFKNIVTRAVGMKEEVEPDIYQRMPRKGEIYLLCSDGLHGYVEDEIIAKIIAKNGSDIDNIAKQLINAALDAGGKDNVTCIIMNVLQGQQNNGSSLSETDTVEIPKAQIDASIKTNPKPLILFIILILIIIISYTLYFN